MLRIDFAVCIPVVVVAEKQISILGNCLRIPESNGNAEVTSPTDRAWIQILFFVDFGGGKLADTPSCLRIFLRYLGIAMQKNTSGGVNSAKKTIYSIL